MLIPVCMGMISSCSNNKADAKDLNGKWNIVEVQGQAVSTVNERTPFMEFNMTENRLHGNAGCNLFNTSIRLDSNDASRISFDQAAATMMACIDMELETKVFDSIENVASVKAGNNDQQMLLVDKDGNTLIVLSRI